VPFPVSIDTIRLREGKIVYGEEFAGRPGRAVLTFSDANILATGLINNRIVGVRRDTRVEASSTFMDEARLSLQLAGPLWATDFSMVATGSLDAMEINRLNPWLTISDELRIQSGRATRADFEINFLKNQSRGQVQLIYRDLSVESIDPRTRSGDGLEERLETFLLNTLKLNSENIPDDSGKIRIGTVNHRRASTETFLSYLWLAVRSGLGDTIGF
jgi:hypothetical protein